MNSDERLKLVRPALSLGAWRSLLAASLLFCPGALPAARQSVDAIAEVLWEEPAHVSTREMLQALSQPTADKSSLAFARVFLEASRRADAETLAELVRIFDSLPPDSSRKETLFTPLADAWLRIRISPTLPEPPMFSETPTKLTPEADGYPHELREAAAECERIKTPFLALPKGTIEFQTNKRAYWNLVSQLLREEAGPWTEYFLAYRWGGYCGTGQEHFVVPQSRALLMALAADRRWSEAAGAALEVTPSLEVEATLRVLQACVPDPLQAVAGGLASLDRNPRSFWNPKRRTTLLSFLLRMPGDDRIRLLTELARHAPVDALPLYFAALGKFISPSAAPAEDEDAAGYVRRSGLRASANLDGVIAHPAGVAAQKQALDFLCSQASPELAIEPATTLAKIFYKKPRAEALPALRGLLDHPSLTVAREAAAALKLGGENADIPPKLGPVRYRIEVDGKPYAQRRVEWIATSDDPISGISSERTTDSSGICELPRDPFLDKSSKPITKVILRNARPPGSDDALFDVQLPVPPNTDDVIPISVQTRPL